MKTVIITGGTDGIGRGLARDALKKGNQVVIIGRNAHKGQLFLQYANKLGASNRAFFFQANLALVSENHRIVNKIKNQFDTIDALILCAQYFSSDRIVTEEGFEQTFSLYYLSRFIFSYQLKNGLVNSAYPIIINVCGPGHGSGKIHWNDLQLSKDYSGLKAMLQSSRANDLLGVGFALNDPKNKIKYVLLNPGLVSTSYAGQYDEKIIHLIEEQKKIAKPVEEGIKPMIKLLENPPVHALTAYKDGTQLNLKHPSFDAKHARKLYQLTKELLQNNIKITD